MYDSLELEVGRTRQFVAGDQLHIAELIDGFDPWREPFVTMWKGLCDALVDGPIIIASSMPYECGWVRLLHQLANAGEFRCVPLELAGDGVVKVLLAPGVSPASWGWPSPYPLEPRPASDRALATGLDSASIGIAWLRDIGVLAH